MMGRHYRGQEAMQQLAWRQTNKRQARQLSAQRGARGDATNSAIELASTLTPAMIKSTMLPYRHAAKRLREGVATEDEHAIVWTMVLIAQAIERSAIIKGLAEHFAAARSALEAVATRAQTTGAWRALPLEFSELDAITDAIEFHEIQLQTVSRRELHEIAYRLINQRQAAGDQVRRVTLQEALKC